MNEANHRYLAVTYSQASGGLWPREYKISTGTVLYRFVDTTRTSAEVGADGPWWFEFEHFQTIKHFASRQGYSLGYSARLFAAILYEWSEVNGIVRARTKLPLVVWKGRGKQINSGGGDIRDVNKSPSGYTTASGAQNVSKMTPMQGMNEVYQLYIPGLGRPHNKFASLFEYLGQESIQTG